NGACGIFMRGLECERALGSAYFYPLWELSADLDLPVCVHSANGSFLHHDFFADDTTFTKFKLAVVGAFHTLLEKEVPKKFPKVRWGFVEVSAQWVPYVLNDLADRFRRQGKSFPADTLAANHLWVACENTDDLPYVLSHAGEDSLMIGTDYGHHDPSSEINAIRLLRDDTRISPAAIDKILETNPRTFYGLK
ncbi:MAG TPA: amidohydrolase family protein, partial [Candidatus Binatia bacterium]|nr:amidohydrolase family protein [Candidatus Binatia bacterium]